MVSLLSRMVIIIAIIVAIDDIAVVYLTQQYPTSAAFVVLAIAIGTIIALSVNVLYWFSRNALAGKKKR